MKTRPWFGASMWTISCTITNSPMAFGISMSWEFRVRRPAREIVEVHAVEDGGIEACEELLGDDQDLWEGILLGEVLADLLLLIVAQIVPLHLHAVVVGGGVDNLGVLGRKMPVQLLLVGGACSPVNSHQEGLEAHGFHILHEVLGQ